MTVNDPDVIRSLLTVPATWAVVGLSNNTNRAAYGVARRLQGLGMTVVPVHPSAPTVHGETGVTSLYELPEPPQVVDIFVNRSLAGDVVDQAIAAGAAAVWLQLGVIDEAAASRASEAGLAVVMDRCPAIEAASLGL